MREDFAELVPLRRGADPRVHRHVGRGGFRSRAWVMSRGEWIRANLNGPAAAARAARRAARLAPSGARRAVQRKALGAQAGGLFGYVARKVLGQYDVVPAARRRGAALLRRSERRRGRAAVLAPAARLPAVDRDPRGDPPRAVRRGAVAARAPARAGRPYLGGPPARSARSSCDQLQRAAEEARARRRLRGMGGIFLLLTPRAARAVLQMQALMSLLEGHASYVMNEVARDHVADVDRMRRALAGAAPVRRASSGRSSRRSGSSRRSSSTTRASASCARWSRARAWTAFNRVWSRPSDLPTLDGDRASPLAGSSGSRRLAGRCAARRPSPGCWSGSRRRPRARDVPAGRPGARVRCRAVPIRCAWSSRSCGCAGSSGSGSRSSTSITASAGLGGRRRVRPPARRRGSGAVPRRGRRRRPRPGRVGRGVGARAAAVRGRRASRARSAPGDRDRAHPRRPGRDRPDARADAARAPAGMAGIRHRRRGRWVRPLLDVTREEVEAFCRSLAPAAAARSDEPRHPVPAQRDPAPRAPRARARDRPERQRTARPDRAGCCREDDDELCGRRSRRFDDVALDGDRRSTGVDLRGDAACSSPSARSPAASVASAVFRCGVRCARADVEAVLDLAAGRPGRRRDLLGGIEGAARPGVCSTRSSFPGRRRDRATASEEGRSRDRHRPSVRLYTDGSRGGLRTRHRARPDHHRGDPGQARRDGRAASRATTPGDSSCSSGSSRARSW